MIIGLFFISLGALIHYGKLYNLIAGYNTMPTSEKKKVDIEGVAKLFWYVMLVMGLAFMSLKSVILTLDIAEYKEVLFWGILIIGLGFLIWQSNPNRYKV